MVEKAKVAFSFGPVRLQRDALLGTGAYGQVCKATLGELPCAAKLLHPILLDPSRPRNRALFEQECRFLSEIRHPNIVQYLGVERDGETGLPILLMELMDDSLTHFLEQSKERLAYHVQVNISHDIALALAFLHANRILHRDLSSNNVLLIGAGIRAKVTDFGMCKLTELNPHMTGLTKCPGTPAYMSPEALLDPPIYTEKLDCFQAGVLMIQTITRKFPDPGPAMNRVKNQISPTGWINMPVPETKRRQKHLNLIASTNLILPIAVDCLKDTDTERPSAQQICHRLSALKGGPQYSQSLDATGRERDREVQERELLIQQLIQENVEREREVREKEREIKNLRDELQQKNDMADQRIHTFTTYVSPSQMGNQPVSYSQADGGSATGGEMTRQYNLPPAAGSGNVLKNAPSSHAGYQQPYTRPAENCTRPAPKPRTCTAMKPAQQYSMADPQMHMRTAPVVTTANLTHPMAAMSISSNPTTATGGNCFICSDTDPEVTGSYFVCQLHAKLMEKQLTALPPAASQADVSKPPQQYQQPNPSVPVGGHPLPPTHGGPLQQPGPSGYPGPQPTVPSRDKVRQQPNYPLTPNIHGANYRSVLPSTQLPSAGQYSTAAMRNPHDIRTPYSEASYMVGGGNPPYNPPPAAGGGVTRPYNPPPAMGGGNMLNNLDTNYSGMGGATAQEYGATGGYGGAFGGGAAPRIIGRIAGSGGGTAGAGFIQAGVSNQANPPAPRKEVLCKTAGCSFYRFEKLENFCCDCYEDYYGMKAPDGYCD